MHRCIELAQKGAGNVAPNPMVGAVLVYGDRIIGEGWHREYGQAHAEVNCINSVKAEDTMLIKESVMYVSLEPCAHYGKTPPCADLIIQKKIPKVVIGCRDPFKEVDGKGIEKLMTAGLEVEEGILENECRELNKRFFMFNAQHRPYIILKWAQTANGKIGGNGGERLLISNDYSNRQVHKWRSEEASILVGTNTALLDNPSLTNRLYTGNTPVRLVVDMQLSLPGHLKVFDNTAKTIVFNSLKHEEKDKLLYYQVTEDVSLVHQVSNALYLLKIQSVLVEGGARLLQSFIDEDMFDEIRVITNTQLEIKEGITAPQVENILLTDSMQLSTDTIAYYHPKTIAR